MPQVSYRTVLCSDRCEEAKDGTACARLVVQPGTEAVQKEKTGISSAGESDKIQGRKDVNACGERG